MKCNSCGENVKSDVKKGLNGNNEQEFSHIEIRAIRNPKWLKYYEQQGFFLSEDFPVADFKLPTGFKNMTEGDIDLLQYRIIHLLRDHLGASLELVE